MFRFRSIFVAFCLTALMTGRASASTEINGLFDARSLAMGGTGVAFLDSAGAIPTNPALLDQIDKLALSLNAFYIRSQPEAPYSVWHLDPATGQRSINYETIRSEAASAVLPFVGGAFRIDERVVVGAAVYPVIGQGASASYRPAPDELPNLVAVNNVAMGLVEGAVPVSIRVSDKLSVGIMWRVTYMTQTLDVPTPTGGAPAGILLAPDQMSSANAKIVSTGMNFAGFQFGLLYKVLPNLRLGLTYRNEVIVEGSGSTTVTLGSNAMVLPTKMGYTNPHMFRAGLALTTMRDKLLLAADFKYLLYAGPFKELKTVTTSASGEDRTAYTPAYWKNAFTVQVGAEYKLTDGFRARAGYVLAESATTPDYAISYMAPPGYAHLFAGGIGLSVLESLNVDLAAGYVVLASYVDKATEHNAGVGTYASRGIEVSLSATYHM